MRWSPWFRRAYPRVSSRMQPPVSGIRRVSQPGLGFLESPCALRFSHRVFRYAPVLPVPIRPLGQKPLHEPIVPEPILFSRRFEPAAKAIRVSEALPEHSCECPSRASALRPFAA